eukprot:scaffold1984_cov130-Isochrysis_galbana.AAC.4
MMCCSFCVVGARVVSCCDVRVRAVWSCRPPDPDVARSCVKMRDARGRCAVCGAAPPAQCIRLERGVRCGGLDWGLP